MPMEHAAAFGVGFLTAYAALLFTGRPRSGERVLVHAAAGAVGSAAVQLARQAGAIVFGTASPGKHAFLRDLGVDHPIDYRGKDFADEVRDLTDGEGVDVILDPIGGDSFVRGLSLLRYGGRLVCYGLSEFVRRSDRLEEDAAAFWKDAAFPAAALLGGAKAVMGSHMGAPPATLHTWMDELLRSYRSGAIAPRIDQVFDLSEAPTAHRWIHDRKNRGKVLLKP